MLIGLKSAYRVARVTSEVRDAGIDTSSPDGQTIPIETVDAIIDRLDAAASLPVPDPIKAQQTLQVFESVNARPPGVLGTLTLMGVHGGSFVVAWEGAGEQEGVAPDPAPLSPLFVNARRSRQTRGKPHLRDGGIPRI